MAETESSELAKEAQEAASANMITTGGGVNATNLKALGDSPAFYNALAMGNAVNAQNAQYQLTLAITSKAAEQIMATSPTEGGVDVAGMLALLKGLMTTPPSVNVPPGGTS